MRNKYCVAEYMSNVYALLLTKLFFHRARLIRRPFFLRGKKSMVFGQGLTTGHSCRFDLPGDRNTLYIGENCHMGDNVHIVAYNKVEIGNNVLMASKVFISDTNHGIYYGDEQSDPLIPPSDRKLETSPVSIGNNVWIGENAVILAGSIIGNGCIIGANSVVKSRYDSNSIIVGAPANAIKKWNTVSSKWERCK